MGQARGRQLPASHSVATRCASSSTSPPTRSSQGADTLVSIGGVQSNHTRQVAAPAAHLGLAACSSRRAGSTGPTRSTTGWATSSCPGSWAPDVRLVQAGFGIGFKESWERALAEIEASGGTPYAIPAGASDHRLGGLGFASWAMRGRAPGAASSGVFFDTVIVCSVTGSTQAGMVAGFAAQDAAARGSSASTARPSRPRPASRSPRIARATAALIEVGRELRDDEIMLDERYHAGHLRHPRRADAGRPSGSQAGSRA